MFVLRASAEETRLPTLSPTCRASIRAFCPPFPIAQGDAK
jgi:hypothetical protein